ncbi:MULTISPECIES: acetolactate synthase small subunit [unclassified Motilimonas]|uniref:acetolactate synthase small subunit n=1 Tax=Motilimonas TaxID=1914248 RepID=UPI001E2D298F|nr:MULTISPECIES: acetolactate synthase small subunit [unclassified Motilimonas]MCE0557098.1 acetolactate synthase small subunit [Motilimonas sp. E26]MDO6524330.1 acetolactate synthase small subunit [Motilimonas sp. 1_MG-2023]
MSDFSQCAILELKVNNHPGVMSHVCGLFARRAFNVEGILCMPMQDKKHSKIWLLVGEDQRLDQLTQQTLKLEDVLEISQHSSSHPVFAQMMEFVE